MRTIESLSKIVEISDSHWNHLRDYSNDPHKTKIARRFSTQEVASIIGKAESTIRAAEKRGAVPEPERDEQGHRAYTIDQIDEVRKGLGIHAGRQPGDDPCIVSVIAYKGGVGKTTTAISLAQYLTLRGKRVLLLDCDPQASTTTYFNYVPDSDIEVDDTLYRVLVRDDRDGEKDKLDPSDMKGLIRDTHWGNLKLVPAMLELSAVEYMMPVEQVRMPRTAQGAGISLRLKEAIDTVSDDFDVIILDAPPSIGMISINAVQAADGLITPMQPSMNEFASAQQFLRMLIGLLERFGAKELAFFRVLINSYVQHKGADAFVNLIRVTYGGHCLQQALGRTREIDNAAATLRSVYELDSPIGDRKTYRRALRMLDAVHGEIESLIESTWPSRADQFEG